MWSCGTGETNQLGTGEMDDAYYPAQIPLLKGKKVAKISAGHLNCGALDEEGNVYVWGWTLSDQPEYVKLFQDEKVKVSDMTVGHGRMVTLGY